MRTDEEIYENDDDMVDDSLEDVLDELDFDDEPEEDEGGGQNDTADSSKEISFDDSEFDDPSAGNILQSNFELGDEVLGNMDMGVGGLSSGRMESLGDFEGSTAEQDDTDYSEGTPVDASELMDDLDEMSLPGAGNDFISRTGDIVVQDTTEDSGDGFELIYLDIDKIAISNRIRKLESVDALVQSVKSTGLLEPLTVMPTSTEGLYLLLDGYRRIQACARAGKSKIPCIVNRMVSVPELPIIEPLYNHCKRYTIKEQVDYIDNLEKNKGIMNPAMIEYLLQMDNGDYTKLKDILSDGDEDIINKMYDGIYDIATAFKKLEARRKKESRDEKENKLADTVYSDTEESGADQIEGSGEFGNDAPLTDDQIADITAMAENIDSDIDNNSLTDMVEDGNSLEGYEAHQQKVGEREIMDPAIRQGIMAKCKFTCMCCKRGGPSMPLVLDAHHVLPVYLGGKDLVENGISVCITCHRQIHLYALGDLPLDAAILKEKKWDELTDDEKQQYTNEHLFEHEKATIKRVVAYGNVIRKAAKDRGLNRQQLKEQHPIGNLGRRMPGKNAPQTQA